MGNLTKKRPYVRVFVTMSTDGKIASRSGDSNLSCPYDLKRLHELRAMSDGIMVGANTVKKDNPLLTPRLVPHIKKPARIVIDGRLSLEPDYKVFDLREAPTYLITTTAGDREKMKKFEEIGVTLIIQDNKNGRINMSGALNALFEKGFRNILVEGGGTLIWTLFKEKLVDEFRVTISPFIIGGKGAITPVEGEGFSDQHEWIRLHLINYILCECGEEIHLIYRVRQ